MTRTPPSESEVYIDGASRGNPGPAGVGIVCLDGTAQPLWRFSKYLGQTTNNVAEYLALIYALQEAWRRDCRRLIIKTDSELLTRQMSGQYRVRDAQLRLLHDVATHLREGFAHCAIVHVPRTANTLADRLAGEAVVTATGLPTT